MEINILPTYAVTDFAQEYNEMLESGYDKIDTRSELRERIGEAWETEIWEVVDSPDNTLDLEFDDVLNEILDDIEDRAEYYRENNLAG